MWQVFFGQDQVIQDHCQVFVVVIESSSVLTVSLLSHGNGDISPVMTDVLPMKI